MLNREWRKAVGVQVLGGMRLALHYTPTQYNPADHPSRRRSIPPPTAACPPWWASGDMPHELDLFGDVRFTRSQSLWVELVSRMLRRAWLRGRRRLPSVSPLSQFDPASLEGDGPRAEPHEREGVDLRVLSMVTRPVAARRQLLLKRLHVWLANRGSSLTALWAGKVEYAHAILADYGQYNFEQGRSLHDYTESLNAVVAGRPEWRRATAKAWRVARAWRSLVPVKSHRPMPQRKLMGPPHLLYIDIGVAKSSHRGGPLHQHARVEDAIFVPFIERLVEQLGPEEKLWPTGAYDFRLRWDALLTELGVPVGQRDGLTPASLRSGGATRMFAMSQDVQLVRWRGRWQDNNTLEHYLQEVGSASIVPRLPPTSRAAVCRWAAQAREAVSRFAARP